MSKSTTMSGSARAHRSDTTAHRDALEALPAPLPDCIASIIKAARLWKNEREEVMRELTAHAQDAIKAGRDPQDIAASMGDPVTVGRLLRRSSRRKRPLAWQIRYRSYQAIMAASVLMFFGYTILFVRFNTGSPTITTNYLAQLNERRNAYSEDQYAITAYEALRLAWARELIMLEAARDASKSSEGVYPMNNVRWAHESMPIASTEHFHYDLLLETHQRLLPLIDETVRASHLPVLGVLYSDRSAQSTTPEGVKITTVLPPSDDPALIDTQLPWLRVIRDNVRLLAFDALLAVRNGDADRATSSLIAVFNTASLAGQEHTWIASHAAFANQEMGEDVLLWILREHPEVLGQQHLRDLAHAVAASAPIAQRLDFFTLQQMFNDMMQRSYTTDARGNGRLTAQGIELLKRVSSEEYLDSFDTAQASPTVATRFVGPLTTMVSGSRGDQNDIYERLIAYAQASLREEPGSAERLRLYEWSMHLHDRFESSPRYMMVDLLAPAFDRDVDAIHTAQAHTDATLVIIALHLHRQRTGQFPETLGELTPGMLPRIPDDPFDPAGQIKYRVVDNTPVVYFIGSNGVDNGGRYPQSASQVNSVRSLELRYGRGYPYGSSPDPAAPANQADWVIFPPQPDSQ